MSETLTPVPLITLGRLARRADVTINTAARRLMRAHIHPDFRAGISSLWREDRAGEIIAAISGK